MKLGKWISSFITAVAGAALAQAPASQPTTQPAPPTFREQIEADWITQAKVNGGGRQTPTVQPKTTEDAAGAVDGIKNGKWGFHTNTSNTVNWWQVDLGGVVPIARVVVYNRCEIPQNAANLSLLLSNDGKEWCEAYRHNGQPFLGYADNKPLVIELDGGAGRFVRIAVPGDRYLHLDEVEVHGGENPEKNIALHRPADQSSVSQWSVKHVPGQPEPERPLPIAQTLEHGRDLIASFRQHNWPVGDCAQTLDRIAAACRGLAPGNSPRHRELYLQARAAIRKLAFTNPLLDFDSLVFVKRAPGVYSHMSDQYYSWWSRPGGGVYILEGIKSAEPRVRCLTGQFAAGSFLSPDLSFDGKKILFAYCRYYDGRQGLGNKVEQARAAGRQLLSRLRDERRWR